MLNFKKFFVLIFTALLFSGCDSGSSDKNNQTEKEGKLTAEEMAIIDKANNYISLNEDASEEEKVASLLAIEGIDKAWCDNDTGCEYVLSSGSRQSYDFPWETSETKTDYSILFED